MRLSTHYWKFPVRTIKSLLKRQVLASITGIRESTTADILDTFYDSMDKAVVACT